jgi:hypothetical protein
VRQPKIDPAIIQLINACRDDIVSFAEDLLGMKLHAGQKIYLRMAMNRTIRLFILTCANRWGKSVTIAILQLYYLFYKIGIDPSDPVAWAKEEYRTANLAPHSANTRAVFKTIDQIMTNHYIIHRKDGTIYTNTCKIKWFYIPERTLRTPPFMQYFNFNCSIEHRSLGSDQGGSLQGLPYGLITYDEGLRSLHLKDELDDAIRPRLFDWSGPCHILCTPSMDKPSTLYGYKLFQQGLVGLNDTYSQTGSLDENTFFSQVQIESQKRAYRNSPLYGQVIEGKFYFGGDTLFNADDILKCQNAALNDGVLYQQNHQYLLSIDTAIGSDERVYNMLDITQKPFQLVRKSAAKGNSMSPVAHMNALVDFAYAYLRYENEYGAPNMTIILETFNGESVRFYHDMPEDLKALTVCYGSWQPDSHRSDNENPDKNERGEIKKAEILIATQKALAAHDIEYPENDEPLMQQLAIYKENDAHIPTDHVISLCMAVYLAMGQEEAALVDWQDS